MAYPYKEKYTYGMEKEEVDQGPIVRVRYGLNEDGRKIGIRVQPVTRKQHQTCSSDSSARHYIALNFAPMGIGATSIPVVDVLTLYLET